RTRHHRLQQPGLQRTLCRRAPGRHGQADRRLPQGGGSVGLERLCCLQVSGIRRGDGCFHRSRFRSRWHQPQGIHRRRAARSRQQCLGVAQIYERQFYRGFALLRGRAATRSDREVL
ncbi:hypothetical protein KXV85_002804, partial [Aspergillus fumigatus]